MSYAKFTIAAAMISIFTISVIMFATNFAADNDASISIADDPDFNIVKTNASNNVQEMYSGSSTAYDAFQKSTVSTQTDTQEGGTQFKITTSSLTSAVRNALVLSWRKLFGEDSQFQVVFTAIILTLTLLSIAYFLKAWKGDPD